MQGETPVFQRAVGIGAPGCIQVAVDQIASLRRIGADLEPAGAGGIFELPCIQRRIGVFLDEARGNPTIRRNLDEAAGYLPVYPVGTPVDCELVAAEAIRLRLDLNGQEQHGEPGAGPVKHPGGVHVLTPPLQERDKPESHFHPKVECTFFTDPMHAKNTCARTS